VKESLKLEPAVDVVVVGGGITGCAVARDAAARGLSVVLLEKTDLAAGTSGRSTKLLHGGLRYLERGHIGLVREALREREITARLAPALARPLELYLPVRPGVFPGRLAARFGVALYDLLASEHPLGRGRSVGAATIYGIAPSLAPGWRGGVSFADRQTDDVRLTIAIARDARRRGASIRLGMEVTRIEGPAAAQQIVGRAEDGTGFRIPAGAVVNATGPWSDTLRRLGGRMRPMMGVSRGAHLVLSGLPLKSALLLAGARKGHRLFAIPWRGATLFGTTDLPDEGDPGRRLPEIGDLRALLAEVQRLFPGAGLTPHSVMSAFTGVRPLLRDAGETLTHSREHRVVDEDGLITIAGGKLTTWRTMAIATVDAVVRRLGRGGATPARLLAEPLLGGDDADPTLDAVLANEMPRHADDVVFRRLPIGHDPAEIARALPSIVTVMGERMGWNASRRADESSRVLSELDAQRRRLEEALGAA
jgi:glycerol-3-phosphate dehydrogenase